MFKIREKLTNKVYDVYDVTFIDGVIYFLIYTIGKNWLYVRCEDYKPV